MYTFRNKQALEIGSVMFLDGDHSYHMLVLLSLFFLVVFVVLVLFWSSLCLAVEVVASSSMTLVFP